MVNESLLALRLCARVGFTCQPNPAVACYRTVLGQHLVPNAKVEVVAALIPGQPAKVDTKSLYLYFTPPVHVAHLFSLMVNIRERVSL